MNQDSHHMKHAIEAKALLSRVNKRNRLIAQTRDRNLWSHSSGFLSIAFVVILLVWLLSDNSKLVYSDNFFLLFYLLIFLTVITHINISRMHQRINSIVDLMEETGLFEDEEKDQFVVEDDGYH